jgi:hypothetical protein
MTNPNDPAFYDASEMDVKPEHIAKGWKYRPGLSKREYFAAMAMQGLCASSDTSVPQDILIGWSVGMADALIAALNKEEKTK